MIIDMFIDIIRCFFRAPMRYTIQKNRFNYCVMNSMQCILCTMQFRLYLPFRSLKSIINIEVLDLLVGAENSIAAWALVVHVLEVVNAAGDADIAPEASDAEGPRNQPG